MTVLIDDTFHCSVQDLTEFAESRVWREMRTWLEARRSRLADDMDNAENEVALKLISCERRVLRDMLELPQLIMDTLNVRDNNIEKDEDEDNARSDDDSTSVE